MKNNTLLNEKDSALLRPVVEKMQNLVPEIKRKMQRDNLQHAFVFKYITDNFRKDNVILCVGASEDACCTALKKLRYSVVEIDSSINYDLHTYRKKNSHKRYPVIFSISVINHVPDDEEYIDDMCKLLIPGGTCIVTYNFDHTHKQGLTSRLYTASDILGRFKEILWKNQCYILGDVDYDKAVGVEYTFGTFIFKKIEYYI